MIDVHCHFLPGIDDGARTLDDSLALARAAVADGIKYSVMTPHMHPGRYDNSRETIEPVFNLVKALFREAGVGLEIGMAAEVRLAPEILPMVDDERVPFLGESAGYRIMLLEFPHDHIPLGAKNMVEKLLKQNIRPLIAHPERNKDVIRDASKIEPFVEMGCWLQITAASVLGDFGDGPLLRARQILELDVFKILASDAHNLTGRRPRLKEGVEAAARVIGAAAADALVHENPRSIVRQEKRPVARS